MDTVTLADDRLVLSAPTESDVDTITALCQDPVIQEWTTVPSPYARSDAEGFVTGMVAAGWAQDKDYTWGIRVDGRLVGMIGLSRQPEGSAEIGYWLGADVRGQGIMDRAIRLVLAWAFDDADGPRLERIEWHAFAPNWASWRAAWRVGFRFEAAVRGAVLQRGRRRDDWAGTLLRDDVREPVLPWPATGVVVPDPPPDVRARDAGSARMAR